MTLKDYVDLKMTHTDKTAEAQGYPLVMENCKSNKKMKQLEIYGNSVQDGTPTPDNPIEVQSVGELVTDEADVNYGKYTIPVVVKGKNIYNAKTVLRSNRLTSIDTIKVKPYTDYVISVDEYTVSVPKWSIRGTNEYMENIPINEVWVTGNLITNEQNVFNSGRYEYILIRSWNENSVYGINENSKIQIEEGKEATEYIPYAEPITSNIFLDEPLHKLGDYADYIDFKNNKIVRKCIKKYLKDYNWYNFTNNVTDHDTHYSYSYKDDSILPNYLVDSTAVSKGYSSHFKTVDSYDAYVTTPDAMHFHKWAMNIKFTLSKEYVADGTIAAFIAWLNENNPYMIRILAEPTEETISLDLPKLRAETAIIEVDTSLTASNAYGKYIKR